MAFHSRRHFLLFREYREVVVLLTLVMQPDQAVHQRWTLLSCSELSFAFVCQTIFFPADIQSFILCYRPQFHFNWKVSDTAWQSHAEVEWTEVPWVHATDLCVEAQICSLNYPGKYCRPVIICKRCCCYHLILLVH